MLNGEQGRDSGCRGWRWTGGCRQSTSTASPAWSRRSTGSRGGSGLGAVEPAGWLAEPDKRWVSDELVSAHPIGGFHHMGTTRMASDPRRGVTDGWGRVHGLPNLHIAGSSLFPTGGWANPTLTILALGAAHRRPDRRRASDVGEAGHQSRGIRERHASAEVPHRRQRPPRLMLGDHGPGHRLHQVLGRAVGLVGDGHDRHRIGRAVGRGQDADVVDPADPALEILAGAGLVAPFPAGLQRRPDPHRAGLGRAHGRQQPLGRGRRQQFAASSAGPRPARPNAARRRHRGRRYSVRTRPCGPTSASAPRAL